MRTWKKTLAFGYPGTDHRNEPITHTVTCRWRSDGVCFFLNSRRYPNQEHTLYQEKQDAVRWAGFLAQDTDVKPEPEDGFDRSFVWNMVSQSGQLLDTGFTVNPKVLEKVMNDPLIKKLKEVESHGH